MESDTWLEVFVPKFAYLGTSFLMAYGRSSNGRELLSDRNISIDFVIPFIHDSGWRLRTVDLTKTVLEVEGMSEEEATYPSPVLSVGLFWIDTI
jgi:hypothetical protein